MAALNFPQISPEIFSIEIGGFNLALRWYALAYIVGILVAVQIVKMLIKRPTLWRDDTPPMSNEQPEDF